MSLSLFKRLIVISILIGVVVVAGYSWYLNKSFNSPYGEHAGKVQFIDVHSGEGLYKVCRRMKSLELVEHVRPFCRVVLWAGYDHLIKGRYAVEPVDTPLTLLKKMVRGDVTTFNISFIEGQNFKQMMARVQQNANVTHKLAGLSEDQIMEKVAGKKIHPEGQFYPDTYTFSYGVSDLEILVRAHKKLQAVLAKEWENKAKDLPYASPYEALIMASIVEKETAVAEERPQIAQVFVNRLNLGMRLQTDPTVIYGMGDDYKGNITRRDLRTKTAYNTYQIKGLPPTPIAMVGSEAIKAALNPKGDDSIFFVARGDGSHHFSKTLRGHNKAVRKYQLRRSQNYRSTPDKP
ncbi:endolytic transglycosylase MltG [Litoribacillus peritrichatus]|uniref:Endolytic murein transglycosylase n=1 Tax=Litoribacillus peritrichatus TaxID=718191 RepID=A0ABP7N245_9GAMM